MPPDIWTGNGPPTAPCYPPCTPVLPPWPLPQPTTIVLPPITTTFAVVSSLSTVREQLRVDHHRLPGDIVTTTIVVPPLTTDEIDWWNVINPPGTGVSVSTIPLAKSILPPPVTILDPAHPNVSLTVHPPLWPPTTRSAPMTTQSGGRPPAVVWSPDKPKPSCTSGCDSHCHNIFCNPICLFCKFPDPDCKFFPPSPP